MDNTKQVFPCMILRKTYQDYEYWVEAEKRNVWDKILTYIALKIFQYVHGNQQ